ncbi:cyclic nucleotide-binding protein [Brumimicrobium salinarum]|uniref:Cyclic nucleotide-binding protein n=1 Tax=Brumimicrobium salinarum TaxID=2058658 RepID=A0A2I0R6X8_9FLAO|nr:Crp/Fnr family transcriptional regulator [Brumimicrobium salinarum]PKR82341.1 cyclic nucleotide-binding protein [Brumimicrobium salinarum]
MAHNYFKKFLLLHLKIDESKIDAILKKSRHSIVHKDDFLLRANAHCKHTFFVEKGLLRQFSTDDKGKEHIISFAPEGWLVTDRESVFFNEPSAYNIQALEDSQVVIIDDELLQRIAQKAPNFVRFNSRLLHNHIRHLQQRINLLLSATAEERYLKFVSMYPNILQRVPQSMIASYLGITPESLSRVRRELTNKT